MGCKASWRRAAVVGRLKLNSTTEPQTNTGVEIFIGEFSNGNLFSKYFYAININAKFLHSNKIKTKNSEQPMNHFIKILT